MIPHALARSGILLLGLALIPLLASGKPIREVEVTAEPEEDGKRIYTIKILPGETVNYEALEFRCIFRQEFPREDLQGRKSMKVHEPIVFVYRHPDARLVDDLHAYFNFRVPVSIERLKKKYGEDVFNQDAPVTVARIRISGIKGEKTLWSHEVEAKGKHTIEESADTPDKHDVELKPEPE
jgi:hypothetical protein